MTLKTITVPLFGFPNQRLINPEATLTAGKDQRFIGIQANIVNNDQAGNRTIYAEKRPGFQTGDTVDSGKVGLAVCDSYGFGSLDGPCTAWGATSLPAAITLYVGTTSIGQTTATTSRQVDITQADIDGEEMYLISIARLGGWYIGETGMAGTTTFTADRTSASVTLANVSSFTGLVVGQLLSGTGIDGAARIASLNPGASSLDMTVAATSGSGTSTTVTRERASKIIDSDFPTPVGAMIEMDGYIFVAQNASQRVYQSDLNSVASWGASNFITANTGVGNLIGISRFKTYIAAHGLDAMSFYYNAGNATGSVLSINKSMTKKMGTSVRATSAVSSIATCTLVKSVDDIVVFAYSAVYMFSDVGLEKISTPEIDKLLGNTTNSAVLLSVYTYVGRYYVELATASWSFVYDVGNKWWSESGFSKRVHFSTHLGYAIYSDVNGDGKLHYFPWIGASQTPVYQDDGVAYTATIQSSMLDLGGGNPITIHRADLMADNQASGTTGCEVTFDDYANFASIGSFDNTQTQKSLFVGGYSQSGRVAFRLTSSANTPWRGTALRLHYSAA